MSPRTRRSLCCWAAAALLPGCGGDRSEAAARPGVVVFAAASLTEVMRDLARAFAATPEGVPVEPVFAGTPQLVLQLTEGARCDVLAAADAQNMARAVAAGAVAEPRVFAHNRLVIAVARGNPHGVHGLADLARDGLVVALCAPAVPAGRYARQALAAAGVALRPATEEPDVKALVARLRLGEIDAGIVYATDVTGVAEVEGVPFAAAAAVAVDYPIAETAAAGPAARAFVDFVCGAAGRRILVQHGFAAP